MLRFVLCVDDEPIRYRQLRKILAEDGIMLVHTCRLEDVEEYLYHSSGKCVGVCLDHDMPFADGRYFAEHFFREHNYPVAIVSHNEPMAKEMKYILDDYETPNMLCKAGSDNFSEIVRNFFLNR